MPTTARERVRAELTAEITEAARRQLAEVGAAALSLRAVARELGMASSALYRYFPSRDELLTRLIIDGYDALGEAAEQADDGSAPPADRWLAVCRAVRAWARAHPQEYALLYGSPVPGYRAPQDTVPAAARVGLLLGRVLGDAARAGLLPETAGERDPGLVSDEAVAGLGGEHTALAVVSSDLLLGALAWLLWHGLLAGPALSVAPAGLRARLAGRVGPGLAVRMSSVRRAIGVLAALVIGAA